MQKIIINKSELLPFKIINFFVSFLLFIFYSIIYLLSVLNRSSYSFGCDELTIMSIVYIVFNFLLHRWIRSIDGIYSVADARVELIVRIFSYFIWFIQPFNVIYDSNYPSADMSLSINGIIMACLMTIMFVCLFGKRNGAILDVKYYFLETRKSKKFNKRKRRRA